jgi:hypothetical protein
MKHTIIPMITIETLCQELKERYSIDITPYELIDELWFHCPVGASAIPYYYGGGPSVYADELELSMTQLLEDEFPDWDMVMIDIGW